MGKLKQSPNKWTAQQKAELKKYCQSDEFKMRMKEMGIEDEKQDVKDRQERIAWWNEIKDKPFTI